ncbi:sterol desaturase family protein [Penaeicola halotolerans]|uniref:sterol desaturase family protein n=1 Tax=Penaeicola halotolerans TaxID=2793196 RepID=UPI001CF929E7|nr:sterol desaturase family protein [Penaeicola halotolerans]
MNLSPVVIAIPIYFILMGIELVVHRLQKHESYRLNDAITNINCGVVSQVSGAFLKVLSIGIYTYFYEFWSITKIPNNIWTISLLFLLYDFCYYWAHRMSHEVNLFWGGHSVHHQSEEYNLSVALRQSSTQVIWTFFFYLPLAFIGFDPVSLVIVSGINLLYQFWIHTESIKSLGWLEYILNTPSHHRVHHARNPKYIDKNHGGTFIIFDRLFGTFQKEEEKPTYGITKQLGSWNPLWANVSHYVQMGTEIKQIPHWKDRLRYVFAKPGWLPDYLGGYRAPHEPRPDERKFDTPSSPTANAYVLFQYLWVLLFTSLFLFKLSDFSTLQKLSAAVMIMWTTVNFSGVFEGKTWFRWLESIRIALFAALLYLLLPISGLDTAYLSILVIGYGIISYLWFIKVIFSYNQHAKSLIS